VTSQRDGAIRLASQRSAVQPQPSEKSTIDFIRRGPRGKPYKLSLIHNQFPAACVLGSPSFTDISPAKAREYVLPALVCVSVCLSVCLSVTTITKKIVDGFVPYFMGRFLGEREDQIQFVFHYNR